MDGKFDEVQPRATVTTSETGVERSVLSRDRWEDLRRARGEGHSVSRLARDFDLDRKTVRRALAQTEWQAYQRDPVAQTLLSDHAAWLAKRAPQVHYSARILFQELKLERGYQGSYDTVRCGTAAARRGSRCVVDPATLRDGAGRAVAGRLGPGARALRR